MRDYLRWLEPSSLWASGRIGAPRPLFRAPMPGNLDDFRNQYVVAKDGKRFLIVTVADNEPLQPIQVIFNWTALLPS